MLSTLLCEQISESETQLRQSGLESRSSIGHRSGKSILRLISGAVVATLLLFSVAAPVSATKSSGVISGKVVFADGSAASHVDVDLYEAVGMWSRGDYISSTQSSASGHYSFDVGSDCYIAIVSAPSGTAFGSADSQKAFDQLYGCAGYELTSVLFRVEQVEHPGNNQPEPEPEPTVDVHPDSVDLFSQLFAAALNSNVADYSGVYSSTNGQNGQDGQDGQSVTVTNSQPVYSQPVYSQPTYYTYDYSYAQPTYDYYTYDYSYAQPTYDYYTYDYSYAQPTYDTYYTYDTYAYDYNAYSYSQPTYDYSYYSYGH